jgi:hypothetical protein
MRPLGAASSTETRLVVEKVRPDGGSGTSSLAPGIEALAFGCSVITPNVEETDFETDHELQPFLPATGMRSRTLRVLAFSGQRYDTETPS